MEWNLNPRQYHMWGNSCNPRGVLLRLFYWGLNNSFLLILLWPKYWRNSSMVFLSPLIREIHLWLWKRNLVDNNQATAVFCFVLLLVAETGSLLDHVCPDFLGSGSSAFVVPGPCFLLVFRAANVLYPYFPTVLASAIADALYLLPLLSLSPTEGSFPSFDTMLLSSQPESL